MLARYTRYSKNAAAAALGIRCGGCLPVWDFDRFLEATLPIVRYALHLNGSADLLTTVLAALFVVIGTLLELTNGMSDDYGGRKACCSRRWFFRLLKFLP